MKLKVILSIAVCYGTMGTYAQFRVRDLRVEHMQNPTVVDVSHPRFSWINETTNTRLRGQQQTAYEIAVSSTQEKLDKGEYDVWDTGKRESSESNLIDFEGKELLDGADYFWKVRTWNQDGKESPWSATGTWGMGLPDKKWEAHWIVGVKDGFEGHLFRKAFTPLRKVKQAKVFVCGLGFFELYFNGQRVGDDYLIPNISNYGKRYDLEHFNISLDNNFRDYRCLYMSYDVTVLMKQEANMLGVMLGNGWYHPDQNNASVFGQSCLRLQMMVTYEDGTYQMIGTDHTWETKLSPIVYSGIYAGELYDANLETPGWCLPEGSSAGWTSANEVEGPSGQMSAMTSPADKITQVLTPVSLKKLGDKKYEVDFGKEIAGWIHFHHLKGIKNDTLRADFVCECVEGAERYIFNGSGDEEYRPYFTWYVFSKAVISGIDNLKASQLTAEAVNTDVPLMAQFKTSNPLFNRIVEIWQNSQTDNMHGCIASDCPHREKLPYTGDGQAAAETVMCNYDAASFYQKWIRDMRDAQNKETGYEPNSAPWQPGCGGGVGWGAAMTMMPWWYYVQYGDRRMLQDSYFNMKDQVRNMLTWVTLDGIMNQKMRNYGRGDICYWLNLGEWVPPKEMPRDELVHTFYLWQCCDYCARAAHALGREEEALHYQGLADKVKANFHREFYDPINKTYGVGGSNIFALRMGVPSTCQNEVIETVRRDILEKEDTCINTGFLGTKYFFETLSDCGLHEVAYQVMNQHKCPSYGWWVDQGALVSWEYWNGTNSRNHPMFGGGLTWFFRYLAGVKPDESQPGFRHILIRPYLTEEKEVSYSRQTPYGLLSSQVLRVKDHHEIQLSIPVGSTATLYLPTTGEIRESGHDLRQASCVAISSIGQGETVLELQQGNYHFSF